MKRKSTDIEKIMRSILLNMSVDFKKEYKIGNYYVDFYLPKYNLSIQCDGCWFHLPKCNCLKIVKIYKRQLFQQRRDKACIAYHIYHNINIIRFKGCEIINNSQEIFKKIQSILKKISNGEVIHEYSKI